MQAGSPALLEGAVVKYDLTIIRWCSQISIPFIERRDKEVGKLHGEANNEDFGTIDEGDYRVFGYRNYEFVLSIIAVIVIFSRRPQAK